MSSLYSRWISCVLLTYSSGRARARVKNRLSMQAAHRYMPSVERSPEINSRDCILYCSVVWHTQESRIDNQDSRLHEHLRRFYSSLFEASSIYIHGSFGAQVFPIAHSIRAIFSFAKRLVPKRNTSSLHTLGGSSPRPTHISTLYYFMFLVPCHRPIDIAEHVVRNQLRVDRAKIIILPIQTNNSLVIWCLPLHVGAFQYIQIV